jgi:small subunit ribosomal protein S4
MARYTKAKTKRSRRANRNLYLKGARSFSAKDDFAKKPFKLSAGGRRTRPSNSEYSKQLTEKQAMRFAYNIVEKQLRNIFKKAFRQQGDTGTIALSLLERRLDNVVYRAGLANSRDQARQLVSHGHFTVNGVMTDIPSFTVRPGDVVKVKENKLKKEFWKLFELQIPNDVPSWLDASTKHTVKVLNLPITDDLPSDFKLPYIVEFYSRKVS